MKPDINVNIMLVVLSAILVAFVFFKGQMNEAYYKKHPPSEQRFNWNPNK
jgi:hypothetical protein